MDTKKFMQDNYVSKLMAFLRGEAQRVASNQEYMKVYQQIIYQCDTNDNNELVYGIFEQFIDEYLRGEVIPLIVHQEGE